MRSCAENERRHSGHSKLVTFRTATITSKSGAPTTECIDLGKSNSSTSTTMASGQSGTKTSATMPRPAR